jgi:hypothetical protein
VEEPRGFELVINLKTAKRSAWCSTVRAAAGG